MPLVLNVNAGYEPLAEAFEQCARVRGLKDPATIRRAYALCGPRYLAGTAIASLGSERETRALEGVAWVAILVQHLSEPGTLGPYQMALDQAQNGKGVKQHGKNFNDGSTMPTPFTEQALFTITEMVGEGFCLGQATKKISEAMVKFDRGEKGACVNELLGAMVYAASTLIKPNNTEKGE